ncbi:hypothetical protein M3Y95_00024400 [Aphelenchoides besseyi]|nr:hypothetical protein M3Y95_00024400 [Aphelenchoides besseyi]
MDISSSSPIVKLTIVIFPIQFLLFVILCFVSLVFYSRGYCNRNRRLRVYMTAIAIADFIIFLMLSLIMASRSKSFVGANNENRTLYFFFFVHAKTWITFVINFASASSTWILTMMLFDHLLGIKKPFAKHLQETSLFTVYVSIFVSVFCSFIVTIYHIFAFKLEKRDETYRMIPNSKSFFSVFSLINIFFNYVIPTIAMFLYVFLIGFHIYKSQKVFSNRNEVTHTATRSVSTDGLRVHRGRRADGRNKVKIVPKMLFGMAGNYLITNLPCVIVVIRFYIIQYGQIYSDASSKLDFELYFISNSCFLFGKIFFHVIVIVSNAPKLIHVFKCLFTNQSELSCQLKESAHSDQRRPSSKTSTYSTASTDKVKEVRRTLSNTTTAKTRCPRTCQEIELQEVRPLRCHSTKIRGKHSLIV